MLLVMGAASTGVAWPEGLVAAAGAPPLRDGVGPIAHGGSPDASSATAHARADTVGLDRGAELAAVTTPVLVIEAPADPAYPPPNAEHLERAIGSAHRVQVPGMGHALPSAVLAPFADALEAHLDAVDATDISGR